MPFDNTTQSVRLTRLHALADLLEALAPDSPDHTFNMAVGLEYSEDFTPDQVVNRECGTVGCIAGYAVTIAMDDPDIQKSLIASIQQAEYHRSVSGRMFADWWTMEYIAIGYLHLTADEADDLFLADLDSDIAETVTSQAAAHAVRRLIDGKQPWPQYNDRCDA